MPGLTACIECTLDLFPPQVKNAILYSYLLLNMTGCLLYITLQVNFPLCTLAHTPRLPEHCIEYVRLLLWSKDNPFGGDEVAIDGDDPAHITWIFEKSLERATHYGIQGVTYRLVFCIH